MYTCYIQSFKILASFCSWAGRFECYLVENPRRHVFAWCGSFHVCCITTCVFTVSTWAVTWQNQQSDCVPSEDSDEPGHLPSLIRVFAVRMKKAWVLSYPLSAQRRLWSDWADAQADLSLRWAHSHFVGFVMSWLTCICKLMHLFNVTGKAIN